MQIRKTRESDIATVMGIFDTARAFMREHGNATQWPVGSPSEETLRADIAAGTSHVCCEDGRVVATFAFVPGVDPTYVHIEGAWRVDAPYCAIHRVASDGTVRGVSHAVFEYCAERADYLRIDTHADNAPMQGAIRKFGFEECGIIHIADGSPRVAFDWLREQ